MKKLLLLFIAVAGLATTASAQKFGRIRTSEVMASLPDMDSVKVKFQSYQKEMESQYEVMVVEYNNKFQDYEKNKAGYSSIILKQKEKELQDAQRRIQDYSTEASQEAEQIQATLLAPITEKVNASIKKVAKAAGMAILVEDEMANQVGSPFPYVDVASLTDITPLVIKDLGGKTPVAPAK